MILRFDGEHALKAVQDNSAMGDSRANGTAKRSVAVEGAGESGEARVGNAVGHDD